MRAHPSYLLALALAVGCASTPDTSADTSADTAAGAAPEAAAETPAAPGDAQDADPMEQMQAWLEMNQPGQQHQLLEPVIGTFRAEITMWAMPGAEPSTSTGSMTNEWIMDGRYVLGHFQGDMMGMPFTGMSITGYDMASQTYQGVWLDSMSTMLMPVSTGSVSPDGKTFTFEREMPDPMTGEMAGMKEVLYVENADGHRFEMWMTAGDMVYKSMEIVYTREALSSETLDKLKGLGYVGD